MPEEHHPPQHNSELTSFEAMLASLVPATKLDRDSVLYEAGRVAGLAEQRSQTSGWARLQKWTITLLVLVSLTTTALWIREWGTTRKVVENPTQEPEHPSKRDVRPPSDAPVADEKGPANDGAEFTLVSSPARDYFELRDRVLVEGMDAFPQTESRSGESHPIPTLGSGYSDI